MPSGPICVWTSIRRNRRAAGFAGAGTAADADAASARHRQRCSLPPRGRRQRSRPPPPPAARVCRQAAQRRRTPPAPRRQSTRDPQRVPNPGCPDGQAASSGITARTGSGSRRRSPCRRFVLGRSLASDGPVRFNLMLIFSGLRPAARLGPVRAADHPLVRFEAVLAHGDGVCGRRVDVLARIRRRADAAAINHDLGARRRRRDLQDRLVRPALPRRSSALPACPPPLPRAEPFRQPAGAALSRARGISSRRALRYPCSSCGRLRRPCIFGAFSPPARADFSPGALSAFPLCSALVGLLLLGRRRRRLRRLRRAATAVSRAWLRWGRWWARSGAGDRRGRRWRAAEPEPRSRPARAPSLSRPPCACRTRACRPRRPPRPRPPAARHDDLAALAAGAPVLGVAAEAAALNRAARLVHHDLHGDRRRRLRRCAAAGRALHAGRSSGGAASGA